MSTSPEVLNIRLSIIKDRHQACPKVNYIVHSTSILYGIRIIISLVMHLRNLSEQTETAVWYPAVWYFFVPFNTKKGMRISPMSIINLSYYQTFHPATQARLMPSLEL